MSELPPKPRPTVEKKLPKEMSINPEVLEASAKAADALESGDKEVAIKEMNLLMTEVSKDFCDHGVLIPPIVEKSIRDKIDDVINQNGKKVIEKVFSPEMQKDLSDYQKQVLNIEHTYQFPQTVPEFYDAARKVRRNTVLGNMATFGMGGVSSLPLALREGIKTLQETQWSKKIIHGFSALRSSLPLIYLFGIIPPLVSGEKVNKQFEESVLKLRHAINKRVSQSVFMRDFEFIHDKPASEIMNVVSKGKEATIDIIRTTYKDVVPNLATIGMAVSTEAIFAPPAGVLALLRVPILARGSEQMARDILRERAENLKRKDMIDARILSSLQSLEVVRTSDNMTNATRELQTNMAKSDEVEQQALTKQGNRDVKQGRSGYAYSFAIPIVSAGWEAIMQHETLLRPDKKTDRNLAMGQVGASFMSTWVLEGINQEMMEAMVHTYTDKIQPALQDIKRMDDLLGPYDEVDTPDGPREKLRQPVENLKNFDIHIDKLNFKNILHDVSLDIPQGSFVTIKGPSGIGKTTFLRHMLGLFGAPSGAVKYGGQDLGNIKKYGEHSIYSKLAYANQNPQYFENMTLRENLQLWTTQQATDEKLSQVLHDLRLDHIADRIDSKVKHFSGGELRRIGIARALLKDPKVLFLDEPTSNLDQQSAKQVLEIVKAMRVKRPEMTVVVVTHDQNFEGIAEKIVDFANVNKPKANEATPLGTRQVFYAAANPKT